MQLLNWLFPDESNSRYTEHERNDSNQCHSNEKLNSIEKKNKNDTKNNLQLQQSHPAMQSLDFWHIVEPYTVIMLRSLPFRQATNAWCVTMCAQCAANSPFAKRIEILTGAHSHNSEMMVSLLYTTHIPSISCYYLAIWFSRTVVVKPINTYMSVCAAQSRDFRFTNFSVRNFLFLRS